MNNILITGAAGFVGGHLKKELVRLGHNVTEAPDRYFHHVVLDRPFDLVFHQAANTDPQDTRRWKMVRSNWTRAVGLFERAIEAGVKKIVYASSAAVYGDGPCPQREDQPVRPLTPYAESKALLDVSASYLSATSGIPVIGLRYSNVYGPGEGHKGKSASVVYQLVQQRKRGENPTLFEHGQQSRDWVSVHDVVRANVLAMDEGVPSGVYNVGSGTSVSFNEVVRLIDTVTGYGLPTLWIKNPYQGRYQDHTCLDLTRSKTVLGYEPTVSLEDGIRELLAS